MSNIDEFYHKNCEKIDANCVNAYVDYHLDEENPAGLCVNTSWGGDCLDLTSIVKAAETVTSLELTPTENPTCLTSHREDGQADCIHGDDLSRIISMTKLKDVDQTTAPVNGDVYIYKNGKFYTFNLQQYMDDTANTINNMQAAIRQLQVLLNYWQVPEGLPANAKIMLGNINLYSDTNAVINSDGTVQSLNKNNGIYGHDLDIDRTQDEIFG